MTRELLPDNHERSPVHDEQPPTADRRSPFTVHRSPFTGLLLALLLTLPALLPLLRGGFFVSDDGLFHLYRTAALAEAWQQGVLWPRLFPDFGFGYGQAVLNFYAPLSYAPAALLSVLGVNPATAVQVVIGLSFLLAAAAAYGYGNFLFGPAGGVLAAVVYTYTPYHLADAYLRGAVPEHAAFIFPPLILWTFTAAFWSGRWRSGGGLRYGASGGADSTHETAADHRSPGFDTLDVSALMPIVRPQPATQPARRHPPVPNSPLTPLLWGSLAWAGLVLTHNLTALLMMPVAVLHLLVLAAWTRHWRRLWGAAGALLLAVGLSALFWLPALVESRAVGLSVAVSEGYINHMLTAATWLRRSLAFFLNPPETLGPLFPLSWFSLALTAVGLILLLAAWARSRTSSFGKGGNRDLPLPVVGFHLAVAIGAMFMTTAASLFIWQPLTALLGQLQYPWRFLLLEAVGLMGVAAALPALLSGRSAPTARRSTWLIVAVVSLLAMLVALPGLRVEPLPLSQADGRLPDRMWAEDAATGQVGATWTGEFLPLTVTEQRWALGRAREGAVDGAALQPAPAVTLTRRGYASWTTQVERAAPWQLRLHQFHQPGWNATIDGRPAAMVATGELGLATVDVPAGTHEIVISFGATPARTAGLLLSLAAAAVWIALAFLRTRSRALRAMGGGAGRLRRGAGAEPGRGPWPADVDAPAGAGYAGGCGRVAGIRCAGASRLGRGGCDPLLAGAARDGGELQGLRASAGARRRGDRPARRRSGGRLHADQPLAARRDHRRPASSDSARGPAGRRVRPARRAIPGGAAAQPGDRSAHGRQPGGHRNNHRARWRGLIAGNEARPSRLVDGQGWLSSLAQRGYCVP
jgi:hypothetical protein